MLSAIGLRKSYGAREVVSGVDIAIQPGEVVGLLGASGSGKSTIFNLLTGVTRPEAGTVLLYERDITAAGLDARARLGLGYVPQSPNLFAELTAEQNLRIAIEARALNAAFSEQLLSAICRAFGLEALRKLRLANLSGGQRRRVEIAYALCGQPRILLLDEPFAGLDPIVTAKLSADITRLAGLGIGVLVTDHKVRDALALVQRAYVIDRGSIIASGCAADIIRSPTVRSVFLGSTFPV